MVRLVTDVVILPEVKPNGSWPITRYEMVQRSSLGPAMPIFFYNELADNALMVLFEPNPRFLRNEIWLFVKLESVIMIQRPIRVRRLPIDSHFFTIISRHCLNITLPYN